MVQKVKIKKIHIVKIPNPTLLPIYPVPTTFIGFLSFQTFLVPDSLFGASRCLSMH